MSYDSDDEARDAILMQARSLLQQIDSYKPLAKAKDSFREEHRSKSHAAWLTAVQACKEHGMTQNAIITRLGVDVRTFIDWKEEKRQIPAWAIAALPPVGRIAYAQALMTPSEHPRLERVG